MTTYFTKNPLGSSSPYDLFDNAQNFDTAVNSITAAIWQDRFGKNRLSWYGIESLATQSMLNYGYITAKSFEKGYTLLTPNTVLQLESNGEHYRWDGNWSQPKVVPPGSTPDSTGGIGAGKWVGVGDAALRSDLNKPEGAELVRAADGETVQQHLDENESDIADLNSVTSTIQNQYGNNHRYKVLYELPLKFSAYDAVALANGYEYLYATGHSFDHFENELWVVYQASGGDTASWWVVFDLTTMVEKTYFRAGKRWTKCFSLIRSGGGRFIYSRSASTGWLAKFDVTTLPAAGSTITETTPPRTEVKYIYASELNGELLVPYDAPTTNTTAYSNTFNILDKDTWSIKRTIRMDTIGAGSEYGTTPYLYKNQGTVMCADGIAIAYGGYYDSENPGTASSDLRIVQGVTIKNADGVNILNGLFDPIGGMSILNSLGKESNRFETEGLYFDSNTGKISTLWHFTDAENGTFLIVEAFSGDENAIDMKPAAIEPRPRLPDIISLWRSDFSKNIPLDPSTGQSLPDVIDICKMMIRYDLRMVVWYATNFSDLTFNGDTFNGTTTFTSSSFVTLERGTNTTCFLKIRNSGMNQEWTISTPESTPTYSQLGMVATQYKFQSTNTGVLCGTGSPEGVVTASPGSIYCNRSGGTTGSVYFKTTGSGNTGWIAK
ncbi:hypothetical protein [Citrobacter braakii]|uniref:tail fiber/spike domain-containing protein n=1 Tax=Citrobacter braakii TaxID=57706 RepID=UPI000CEEB5F3|nr:hypothetical protein [Citrobacter braakii]PPS52031.1 hypothetical protein BWR12_04650 [Citrobacter braakii]